MRRLIGDTTVPHHCQPSSNRTIIALLLFLLSQPASCLLFPRDSPSRQSKSLNGVWNFKTTEGPDQEKGFTENWFGSALQDTISMPVPASYNDITVDAGLRDFVGWAWYDQTFYVDSSWHDKRIMLRFGSVHYTAMVYVNGQHLVTHAGGHLPFEAEVGPLLTFVDENRVTVAVNNTLSRFTVPQGEVRWQPESPKYPAGYSTLSYNFDFFNYAGIHRPVTLYTTPRGIFIKDITTSCQVSEDLKTATLKFSTNVAVSSTEEKDGVQCTVQLWDSGHQVATEAHSCTGEMVVVQPNLWWPHLMSEQPGHMMMLRVVAMHIAGGSDEYRQPIGLREVSWGSSTFKINHQPFYFRGFGRHEDSNIRGKGLDLPLTARDHNLIKWMGANSYRTSHYPYAEEILDFADQNGIVIIDECPAVALDHFDDPLLKNHLQMMTDLVDRDKNRPSVVMWSAGNEPRSYRNRSGSYFAKVADLTRSLDSTRPVTLVTNVGWDQDLASQHFDIIAINRYFGWYSDPGHLELIERQMLAELRAWRKARGKPIMITEYGADTVAGLHMEPGMVFTEEYQAELMRENFKAFDTARAEGWFIGEMIWNFADFMTKQEPRRVAGNKKGVFTRERQPKISAHVLRRRYWGLAEALDGQKSPSLVI